MPVVLLVTIWSEENTQNKSKIHMKIEVNTVRSSRGDLSNQLPAAADRCLRSNRCKSKGKPGTAVPWRVDEEAKGIGSPGPLLLESSGDASLRARRDKWGRAAGSQSGEPLYTSPPGWTGLQVLEPRVWLQPAGWRAPVGSVSVCHGTA